MGGINILEVIRWGMGNRGWEPVPWGIWEYL